ncbi:MAG: ribonuclease E/G, partial [Lachnospiraceae bacterium]|nr:ribonuclease E/G [Lachnospiraceae bacterium]
MNQLLITRQGKAIVSAGYNEKQGIFQFHVVPDEGEVRIELGDIFVGQVQNIVPNIGAAFVGLAPGVNGYLALEENRFPCYANPKNTEKLCIGDKLLVQVRREP